MLAEQEIFFFFFFFCQRKRRSSTFENVLRRELRKPSIELQFAQKIPSLSCEQCEQLGCPWVGRDGNIRYRLPQTRDQVVRRDQVHLEWRRLCRGFFQSLDSPCILSLQWRFKPKFLIPVLSTGVFQMQMQSAESRRGMIQENFEDENR